MSDQSMRDNKWKEIKNEIQKTWGLLTHDEIEKAKGSLHSLTGTIQKKYGMARHEVVQKLTQFIDRLSKSEEQKPSKKSMDQNP